MPSLDHSEPETDRRAPPVARRSALSCTKLRDSCHACATSKIKCPKEKPSCSKCEARGVECQYFFARRPGRRREDGSGHQTRCTNSSTTATTTTTISSISTNSTNDSSSSSLSPSPVSNPTSIPDIDTHGAPSLSGDKLEAVGPPSQDGYATNSTPPSTRLLAIDSFLKTSQSLMIEPALSTDNILGQYPSNLSSILADPNMFQPLLDFDPPSTDMDFSITDYFEHPSINIDGISSNLNDTGSLLIPEIVSFDLDTLDLHDSLSASFAVASWRPSPPRSVPTLSSTTNSDLMTSAMMRGPTTDTSCGCMVQALDLLKTLSLAQASHASSIFGTGSSLSASITAMGSMQAILVENKQHVESVSIMLSCSACTEDAFRLILLSMVVLKILERYASVARIQAFDPTVGSVGTGQMSANSMIPSSKDQVSAPSGTYSIPRDDGATVSAPAQLVVLGELHQVQRLVDQLMSKLRGEECDTQTVEQSTWGRFQVTNANDEIQSTLSSNTLAQVESDMRNALRSLSTHIIIRLRQIQNIGSDS